MSVVQTLIGNIKGPQGATGATGATGAQGPAATVEAGSVTTTAYGNPAQVTNVGTSSAAVFDFVIPQGKPGEKTTKMGELELDSITTSTASFPSPAVDDTGAVAFGKIVKFFADTVSALSDKLNKSNVVNNFTTTTEGYALDARAGKTLNDSLTPVYYAQDELSVSNIAPGITINEYKITKVGKILFLDLNFSASSAKSNGDALFAITTPGGLVKTNGTPKSILSRTGSTPSACLLRANGTGSSSAIIYASSNVDIGNYYCGTMILVQG